MPFFKKEALEDPKGWTAAAVVVGAGVVAYVAYKYYKDTLKGDKSSEEESQKLPTEEVTYKATAGQQRDSAISSTFDKLEDVSKEVLKKDSDISDSFVVLSEELPKASDVTKHLDKVGEKITEEAKSVAGKLEEYKEDATKKLDAGVKAVSETIEGYSEDLNKGVKEATQQINQVGKEASEKVQEGVKQAAHAVEDFKTASHSQIDAVAKQTSDALHGVTEDAHKKLDEGAADLSKKL